MKNIGFISKNFTDNSCFVDSKIQNPVDDKNRKFRVLRATFKKFDFNLESYDVLLKKNVHIDAFLIKDHVGWSHQFVNGPSMLLAMESAAVEPQLFEVSYLLRHNAVLSWKQLSHIIPNYSELNYHFDFSDETNIGQHGILGSKRQFEVVCVQSFFPLGFSVNDYTERQKLISKAAAHLGNQFCLYGKGWNQIDFRSTIANKVLNRSKLVRKTFSFRRRFYFGTVESKWNALRHANFALAIENDIAEGYVTEKIFDCFLSGTIPIYRGPASVKKVIDPHAFIFLDDFKSVEHALDHALALSRNERLEMLKAAAKWMKNDSAQFDLHTAADKIIKKMMEIMNE